MSSRRVRSKPMYCGVTTVYPPSLSMWRILACGPDRKEVEAASRERIGPIVPPGNMAPDIYRETEHKNLRVMSRSEVIRRFGRVRFYEMYDATGDD